MHPDTEHEVNLHAQLTAVQNAFTTPTATGLERIYPQLNPDIDIHGLHDGHANSHSRPSSPSPSNTDYQRPPKRPRLDLDNSNSSLEDPNSGAASGHGDDRTAATISSFSSASIEITSYRKRQLALDVVQNRNLTEEQVSEVTEQFVKVSHTVLQL
jgi:hypothetical protein